MEGKVHRKGWISVKQMEVIILIAKELDTLIKEWQRNPVAKYG